MDTDCSSTNKRIDEILRALREAFPSEEIQPTRVPINEIFITLPPDGIEVAVQTLIERFNLHHLSTITGQDTGHNIELLYHFWDSGGLTLRTRLPRETPVIATITNLIPGAAFYEREIWEMLGVHFEGHPNLSLFLLPEDWDNSPPLLAPTPGDVASEDEADCASPNDNQNGKLEDQEGKL